jgi:hypothetical protein
MFRQGGGVRLSRGFIDEELARVMHSDVCFFSLMQATLFVCQPISRPHVHLFFHSLKTVFGRETCTTDLLEGLVKTWEPFSEKYI